MLSSKFTNRINTSVFALWIKIQDNNWIKNYRFSYWWKIVTQAINHIGNMNNCIQTIETKLVTNIYVLTTTLLIQHPIQTLIIDSIYVYLYMRRERERENLVSPCNIILQQTMCAVFIVQWAHYELYSFLYGILD